MCNFRTKILYFLMKLTIFVIVIKKIDTHQYNDTLQD